MKNSFAILNILKLTTTLYSALFTYVEER